MIGFKLFMPIVLPDKLPNIVSPMFNLLFDEVSPEPAPYPIKILLPPTLLYPAESPI